MHRQTINAIVKNHCVASFISEASVEEEICKSMVYRLYRLGRVERARFAARSAR